MSTYVLAVVGGLVTLAVIVELLRRGQLREKYAALWLVVGVGVIVVAFVPHTLEAFSRWLGVQTPVNLLFFVGALVLLTVSVHLSWEVSRMEEENRRLAEEYALLRHELDDLKRSVGR